MTPRKVKVCKTCGKVNLATINFCYMCWANLPLSTYHPKEK